MYVQGQVPIPIVLEKEITMSAIAAIVAQSERESLGTCQDEIRRFHLSVIGWKEMVMDFASACIPPLQKQRKKKDGVFLTALREYIPQIRASVVVYHHMFHRWERQNRCGPGSQEIRNAERAAEQFAHALTEGLQEKLTAMGWKYRPIESIDDLVMSPYPGQLLIGKATAYYDSLLELFEKRAS